METIRNIFFEGQSINVDHKHFIECTFKDCILEYSGQSFTFERTQLTNCRYVFFGLARGTVHFLQCIGLLAEDPEQWVELSESVN
jgi:hypothetical protein